MPRHTLRSKYNDQLMLSAEVGEYFKYELYIFVAESQLKKQPGRALALHTTDISHVRVVIGPYLRRATWLASPGSTTHPVADPAG